VPEASFYKSHFFICFTADVHTTVFEIKSSQHIIWMNIEKGVEFI